MKKPYINLKNLYYILPLLLFFNAFSAFGQGEDKLLEEDRELLTAVAEVIQGNGNMANRLLSNIGFSEPDYIKDNWNKFPTYKKIEIAIKAAENNEKGNGKKVLALLSKALAQEYQPVQYVDILKPLLQSEITGTSLAFKFPTKQKKYDRKFSKITLDDALKKQIFTLSNYMDNGALGGLVTVLNTKFGLDYDAIFNIVSRSNSFYDVLEDGLLTSTKPEHFKAKLIDLASELYENYQAVKKDAVIVDQLTKYEALKAAQDKVVKKGEALSNTIWISEAKVDMETTPLFNAKKGITFLENIHNPNSPLQYVHFIPDDYYFFQDDDIGTLEFIFKDGKKVVETSVFKTEIVKKYIDFLLQENIQIQHKTAFSVNENQFYIDMVQVENERLFDKLDESKYEILRQRFTYDVSYSYNSIYTDAQTKRFRDFLEDWDRFKIAQKDNLTLQYRANLETLFFDFIKDNDTYKANWNEILFQMEDSNLHEYCAKIGKSDAYKEKGVLGTFYNEAVVTAKNAIANDIVFQSFNNSKWERDRNYFKDNLFRGSYDKNWTFLQRLTFQRFFSEWETYKEANKEKLLTVYKENLEHFFFDFIKDNAVFKACFGYIIQQNDGQGAYQFFNSNYPLLLKKITRKPAVELYYYCHAIGKGEYFPTVFFLKVYGFSEVTYKEYYDKAKKEREGYKEKLTIMYDEETNKQVGDLCPPTH